MGLVLRSVLSLWRQMKKISCSRDTPTPTVPKTEMVPEYRQSVTTRSPGARVPTDVGQTAPSLVEGSFPPPCVRRVCLPVRVHASLPRGSLPAARPAPGPGGATPPPLLAAGPLVPARLWAPASRPTGLLPPRRLVLRAAPARKFPDTALSGRHICRGHLNTASQSASTLVREERWGQLPGIFSVGPRPPGIGSCFPHSL